MNKSIGVIITTGGLGKRMKKNVPKQFLEIDGVPIFVLTLNKFFSLLPNSPIVLVMPEDYMEEALNIINTLSYRDKIHLVKGGKERFHSVQNGLTMLETDWVMVHDGVRPFVSKEVITSAMSQLQHHEAVVPVISIQETLRKIESEDSITVNRNLYKIVQTPQSFHTSVLKEAYNQSFSPTFTDDASVVESIGKIITLIEGNKENLKITEPIDLSWAAFLLQKEKENG